MLDEDACVYAQRVNDDDGSASEEHMGSEQKDLSVYGRIPRQAKRACVDGDHLMTASMTRTGHTASPLTPLHIFSCGSQEYIQKRRSSCA